MAPLQKSSLISNPDVTMGFDATTQEGIHINSINFTNEIEVSLTLTACDSYSHTQINDMNDWPA